jgi:hypothetical protein
MNFGPPTKRGQCQDAPPPAGLTFVGLPQCLALRYISEIMQVTVELPDQVARRWGATPDAVDRHLMKNAAIEG